MIITLFDFAKRTNSTKRPASGGTQFDVYLKDNCSRERPVFVITGVDWHYNYLQWGDHYYYIDDIIILTNDHMELHCTEDVLATYRDDIGAYTAFIERSSNTYDELLNDSLLSSQQDISTVKTADTAINGSEGAVDTTGCYMLQTFGQHGVHLYAYTDLTQILGILNNSAYGLTGTQLDALVQSIGLNLLDVSAYVSNVRWVPFSYASFNGSMEDVEVSFWQLNGFTAKHVSDRSITISGTITQPVNEYTDFRARSPRFSKYTLYLPGVGTVGLDPIDVYGATLTYTMSFDLFTGEVMYMIYTQTGVDQHIIGTYSGKLACDIPYSTTSRDVWGVIDTLIGGGGSVGSGVGTGANAASAAAGAAMSIGQAEAAAVQTYVSPSHSFNAAVGNISKIRKWPNIRLSVANYGSKDYMTPYAGRPLCEIAQIRTLPGYVKCAMPALEIAGLASERDQVNSYLASGFYFE